MISIRHKICAAGAALLAMLTAACSTESIQDPETANNAGRGEVIFSLAGAPTASSRAATEIQDQTEKAIRNLYAVVFRVNTGDYVDMTSKTPSASYPMYSVINVFDDSDDHGGESFKLDISTPDRYFITFVANADSDFKTYLDNAITSNPGINIETFKAQIADQMPTDCGNTTDKFLMTSEFYGVNLLNAFSVELGVVDMQRVHARIDIYNQAEGIQLSGLRFINRAITGKLITDYTAADFASGSVETADIAVSPIEVNDAWNKIYTYEQFGTDDAAPALEIKYKEKGENGYDAAVEKTLTVNFKNADDRVINIKRNHLYRVYVNCDNGKLTFTITVDDWDEYGQIDSSKDDLQNYAVWGDDPDDVDIAIGDFITSEGRIIKRDMIKWNILPNEVKKSIVGVVFETDPEYIGDEGKAKALANGASKIHGTAISLKYYNAGSEDPNVYVFEWGSSLPTKAADSELNIVSYTKDGYWADRDGYSNTRKLCDKYPAQGGAPFNVVMGGKYQNQIPAPAKSSGWYLPAAGECMRMMITFGETTYTNISSNHADNQYIANTVMRKYFEAVGQALDESNNSFNLWYGFPYAEKLFNNTQGTTHESITYCSTVSNRGNYNDNCAIRMIFANGGTYLNCWTNDNGHSVLRGCFVF